MANLNCLSSQSRIFCYIVNDRSTTVRTAQSATVVEDQTHSDRHLQCSECRKSFRSQTLLDYHKKYYHHVAATSRSRRTSVPPLPTSSHVERAPSGRFRSKNKSACMCGRLLLDLSCLLIIYFCHR